MNRRLFLGLLGSAAIADPERLLWVPGKKKIFIPKEISPKFPWFQLVRVPRYIPPNISHSCDGSLGRSSYWKVSSDLLWYPVGSQLPPDAQVIHTAHVKIERMDAATKFPIRADRADGLAWLLQGASERMSLEEYKALAPFQPDAHRRQLLQTRS